MRSSSSSCLLDVHSSTQSNHDDSLLPNMNANDDITIGFRYSSDDSEPSAVPSYSYFVTSSVENFVESQPLSCRRVRTSHCTSRRRRRPQRQHRAPQSSVLQTSETPKVGAVRSHIRCSSQSVDAVDRTRNAVPVFPYCSNGEIFEHGALIGFAGIQYPY